MEDSVRLLVRHRNLESGLVLVGVKRFTHRANLLKTVLLKSVEEDLLSHLNTGVKVDKLLVGRLLNLGNSVKSTLKVVNRLNEVLGKLLDGEVFGSLLFALGSVLEVTEIGNSASELVLQL